MKPAKAVRMYSLNQPKVDEACQQMADFVIEIASNEALARIKKKIEKKLEAVNEKV